VTAIIILVIYDDITATKQEVMDKINGYTDLYMLASAGMWRLTYTANCYYRFT
jgi:hypothetical protein